MSSIDILAVALFLGAKVIILIALRLSESPRFWYIVHQCIAHPLLITGTDWADRFHDYTEEKM